MDNWIRIQSAILAAILTTALVINIALRKKRTKINNDFILFGLNIILWYLSDASVVSFEKTYPFFDSLRSVIASIIPLTSMRFFTGFLQSRKGVGKQASIIFPIITLSFIILIFFAPPQSKEIVHELLFIYVFIGLYSNILLIYLHFLPSEEAEKTRLKYLMISGLVVFTIALFDYIPDYGTFIFGNIFSFLFMFFLFQIITKHRIPDIYEFVGKAIVLSSFAFVVAIIYFLLVVWSRGNLSLFIFNTLIASIVIFILFDPLKGYVEEFIDRIIFKKEFEFKSRIEKLKSSMSSVIDINDLVKMILQNFENSKRVTHSSIYILDKDATSYIKMGNIGPEGIERLDVVKHRAFIEHLKMKHVLIYENLLDELIDKENKLNDVKDQGDLEILREIIKIMKNIYAGVSFGFLSEGSLTGLLNIKDDRVKEPFSSDEIKILASLAGQISIVIENTKLFEKIVERDRLAVLGEMAAGIAHEIRNPLSSIKGATQLIIDSRNGEGRTHDDEFLQIIIEEVDRLNTVLSQFLNYARPLKPNISEVNINEVIEKTVMLIKTDKRFPHTMKFNLLKTPPVIKTDQEFLRNVFINLSLNAFEAMPDGGELYIETSMVQDKSSDVNEKGKDGYLRIKFKDTGVGMDENEVHHLFIPFWTTKEKGTGLGLAITHRIVKSLGGFIEVSSKKGQGSTFDVYIPVVRG